MNRLSSRLAARAGTRQVEILARADDAADAADRAVVAAWSELMGLLQQPGPLSLRWRAMQHAIGKLLTAPRAALQAQLGALVHLGHQSAAGVLVQTLPIPYLQHAANRAGLRESRLMEDAGSVRLSVGTGKLTTQSQFPHEPARARMADDELRARFERLLFAPPSVAQVAAILKRPINGQSWEQDLGQASKLAGFDPHHMASTIAIAFSAGKNIREIAKDLEPVVNGVKSSARRIGRTYGMQVAHHAQMQAHEAVDDLIVGYQVRALLDYNTRPWHSHRSGTIYYKHPTGDQKGLFQMPNPPLEAEDPNERPSGTPKMSWNCRCVLPGTRIQGRIKAALKSWYSGEVVKICTRRGHYLSLTVNHPVAAESGFVSAGSLQEGDNLLCYVGDNQTVAVMDDEQDSPALIEDVFCALERLGSVAIESRSAFDFHGDAQFMVGQINVVRAYRELAFEPVSNGCQRFFQDDFMGRDVRLPLVFGYGLFDFRGRAGHSSDITGRNSIRVCCPGARVRSQRLPSQLHGPGLAASITSSHFESSCYSAVSHSKYCGDVPNRFARIEQLHDSLSVQDDGLVQHGRFGSGSERDAVPSQVSGKRAAKNTDFDSKADNCFASDISLDNAFRDNDAASKFRSIGPGAELDARLAHPAGEFVPVDLQCFRELRNRFPGSVATDDVVHVDRYHYDGPVYDLESDTGYYMANGVQCTGALIVSNCHLSPVLTPVEALVDAPEFVNNAHKVIPDPTTYRDWWAQVDDRRRKLAVGARRFAVVADDGPPRWEDFVDPKTGNLLTAAQLQRETPDERYARVQEVQKQIAKARQSIRQVSAFGFAPQPVASR